MKKLMGASLVALMFAFSAIPQQSKAFGLCNTENTVDTCFNNREAFWLTSTTFTGPLALLLSGEFDLTKPEIKETVVLQAKQISQGNGSQINDSENVVRMLAYSYGVSDVRMAEAILKLSASNTALTDENIRKAL